MALPVMVNLPAGQFGYHGAMDAHAYQREDFFAEVEPFWDASFLDPSLRDFDNPMALYPEWEQSEQSWSQFPGDSSHLMAPFQVQPVQKTLNRPYEATGPIPRPYEHARGSPTASSCSSITSPGMDGDWYLETYQHPARVKDNWDVKPLSMPAAGLVQMSAVQGIPDPEVQGLPNDQEVVFNADGYDMGVDSGMDFPLEAEGRTVRSEEMREHYGRSSEEEGSRLLHPSGASSELHASEPAMTEDAEGDVDAEWEEANESEEGMNGIEDAPVEEEEDPDTEYKPKASRNKRRRSSRTSSSPSGKKNKVSKALSRRSQFQCKICEHYAKDAAALARHVAAAHTRPYVCSFAFAGCKSTFGNKNEWKRHVSSQHLGLQYWVCSEGNCPASKSNLAGKDASSSRLKLVSNIFNRKDLFTQHLKRMHMPHNVKLSKKPSELEKKTSEWDERVRELQSSCLVIRRNPPSKMKCPVRQCGQIFEGPNSWDEMMEHVGRHLEKSVLPAHGDSINKTVEQEGDEFLVQWALKERIIERKGSGYKFCSQGEPTGDEENDAEGDDE